MKIGALNNRNEFHTVNGGHGIVGTVGGATTRHISRQGGEGGVRVDLRSGGPSMVYVDVFMVVFLADVLWVYSLLEVRFAEVFMQVVLSLGRFALISGVLFDPYLALYVGGSHFVALFAYGYIAKFRHRLWSFKAQRGASAQEVSIAVHTWAAEGVPLAQAGIT
jgi:hypothetical protein